MKSPTPEEKFAEGVFQIQSPICSANFSPATPTPYAWSDH